MSFFTIEEITKTLTIRNKKRISLITSLDESSMIIFYQDRSYEHREIFSDKIIHEGKMDFVVTEILKPIKVESDNNGRKENIKLTSYIGVLGERDDKTIIFGILNIRSLIYQPYEVTQFETLREAESVNFHLLESISSQPFLVMVSMNVENGIMIQCFDFETKIWMYNVLYLGSKFLSYLAIGVPSMMGNEESLACLLLLANGEKSESVHMACLGIKREKTLQSQINLTEESFSVDNSIISEANPSSLNSNKKIEFLFTREIKYQVNFTVLGGHISANGNLFLIGNSLTFKTKERKQLLWQPQCVTMNFNNLMMNNNLDPLARFVDLQGFKIGKEIIVREYLGYVDNSMIFVVENPLKRSLHKVNPEMLIKKQENFDEEVHTLKSHKPTDIMLSCDNNTFLSYELVCEQYFEKIKDTPSVIKLEILRKISKKMYYQNIMKQLSPEETSFNEAFIQSVIDCL